jgi:hypothetical protein
MLQLLPFTLTSNSTSSGLLNLVEQLPDNNTLDLDTLPIIVYIFIQNITLYPKLHFQIIITFEDDISYHDSRRISAINKII